jgi:ABC-2 type transport system permease protein
VISRPFVKKYLGQASLLWGACAICLFAFAWIRVWVVSLLDMNQFKSIIEQFRDYERFSPIPFDQLISYSGRIGATFDEPIVILCIVVWAVARGSDMVSGEINRGTMELLMAQPISRSRFLLSNVSVAVVGLLGLVMLVWLGVFAGIQTVTIQEAPAVAWYRVPWLDWILPAGGRSTEVILTPMRERVTAGIFAGAVLNLFSFGFFLLGLATALSACDRYRWRTIGLVITVYILSAIAFALSKAAATLQWLKYFSFFSLYQPQRLTQHLANPSSGDGWLWLSPLGLIAIGLIGLLVAIRVLERRDLPAPL